MHLATNHWQRPRGGRGEGYQGIDRNDKETRRKVETNPLSISWPFRKLRLFSSGKTLGKGVCGGVGVEVWGCVSEKDAETQEQEARERKTKCVWKRAP